MRVGDLLYFWAEDTALMIVMVGIEGARVYDTKNPEFDDDGNIITKYVTYEALNEVCSLASNVDDILDLTVNRSDVELPNEFKNDILEIRK